MLASIKKQLLQLKKIFRPLLGFDLTIFQCEDKSSAPIATRVNERTFICFLPWKQWIIFSGTLSYLVLMKFNHYLKIRFSIKAHMMFFQHFFPFVHFIFNQKQKKKLSNRAFHHSRENSFKHSSPSAQSYNYYFSKKKEI